jgi:PAS domain S-box-containing protein
MLIGNWRHTRRRMQAQQALMAETNFRRAMENSMLTGMRALDMHGRITYVNAAFCADDGLERSRAGGPHAALPLLARVRPRGAAARLDDELHGRTLPGGFQVRVKRKDGSLFDARLYVSPLIDAKGHQTGWMTSMTDITEPNRIREQLRPRTSASPPCWRRWTHRCRWPPGQRGAAVRQQAVPPVVRLRHGGPPADGGAGRRAGIAAHRRIAGRRRLLRRPADRTR